MIGEEVNWVIVAAVPVTDPKSEKEWISSFRQISGGDEEIFEEYLTEFEKDQEALLSADWSKVTAENLNTDSVPVIFSDGSVLELVAGCEGLEVINSFSSLAEYEALQK